MPCLVGESKTHERIEEANLRYLILVGGHGFRDGDVSADAWVIGGTYDEWWVYEARVFSLETGDEVGHPESESEAGGLVLFGFGARGDARAASCSGLGDEVVRWARSAR